jgi:prepilin signal peptidase PulO-like enzyme (type II secretory pathway)
MNLLVIFKIAIIFILGLILGSFANVVVDRGQKGKSLGGRSKCDKCHRQLSWYDNIPLLSYLFLRGKCRQCGEKISWHYPAVEMLFGGMFLLIAWRTGGIIGFLDKADLINTIFYLAVGFVLLIILVWDLKYMIIPDGLVVGGLILAVIYFGYQYVISPDFLMNVDTDLTRNFLGGLIIGGFFYLMFAISQGRWIGGGDIKLGFLLGFLVGWREVYFLLMIAYILGSIPAIYLLLTKKATTKTKIPFGPFLIVAGLVMMFWGPEVIGWWQKLMS